MHDYCLQDALFNVATIPISQPIKRGLFDVGYPYPTLR